MKRVVFLTVLLSAVAAAGQEWEGDLLTESGELRARAGITWDSKWIWRGFDMYHDKSATHVSADLDLFQTGIGASVVAHRANGSGFEDRERWDGTVFYQSGVLAGDPWAMNYRIGYVYYLYPELNSGESVDQQEGQLVLSWPNLLPIQGLQPSYVLIGMWQTEYDGPLYEIGTGFMHILMLDYAFGIPGIVPEIPEHVITLHSELVYNDGVTVATEFPDPDHGFSHAVFGASTDLAFGPENRIVFTPAIYYQITMDRSVNDDDDGNNELWGSFALRYAF